MEFSDVKFFKLILQTNILYLNDFIHFYEKIKIL